MNQTIKVKRTEVKDIIERSFPEYRGRKFTIEFTTNVIFGDTNWGGGSRSYYHAITADGKSKPLPNYSPFNNPVEGKTVDLPADVIVVEHSIFCGQDCGIHIYANPVHTPRWLKA